MTYAGPSSRSSNRVLISLVIITIVIVTFWAVSGGLDDIPQTEAETVVVTE